jgi:hypothetical protein
MNTYLLKLGPDMLGAYAKPIDRRIAGALPCLAVRLRLQDMAQLMADALVRPLSDDPLRPLTFLNIAGGTAIDSLNALILLQKNQLQKNQPGLLAQRRVLIEVLDLEEVAPRFGEDALAALLAEGAPLHGTRIAFRHIRYDWSQASALEPVLGEARAQGALVIGCSEGGLFEYGSDDEIESNLKLLRAAQEVLAVVGSVTRADEPIRQLHATSRAATRPRGLPVFRELARKAGWNIARVIERPFSDQVVLT